MKMANLPSRELTYPTWGKGKSSLKYHFWGDMLVPWRVSSSDLENQSKKPIGISVVRSQKKRDCIRKLRLQCGVRGPLCFLWVLFTYLTLDGKVTLT